MGAPVHHDGHATWIHSRDCGVYSKLSVPAMADTFSADVDAKFAAAIEGAEGAVSASEVRIKELEEQLAALDNRPNWSDVTIEEELAKSPEIAAEIEEEISQQKW